MRSELLKKAFLGDEYALILLTEQIREKTLSVNDFKAIMKVGAVDNSHQKYLRACCYFYAPHGEKNAMLAKRLLKPLVSGDGFAENLLGHICIEEDTSSSRKKGKFWFNEAIKSANPLVIYDALDTRRLYTDSPDISHEILHYITKIYNQISPKMQKSCVQKLSSRALTYSPKDWYSLALFYKKIGDHYKMFNTLHQSIELTDKHQKYLKKLAKIIEQDELDQERKAQTHFFKKVNPDTILARLLLETKKILHILDKKMSPRLADKATLDKYHKALEALKIAYKNSQYYYDARAIDLSLSQEKIARKELPLLANQIRILRERFDALRNGTSSHTLSSSK